MADFHRDTGGYLGGFSVPSGDETAGANASATEHGGSKSKIDLALEKVPTWAKVVLVGGVALWIFSRSR